MFYKKWKESFCIISHLVKEYTQHFYIIHGQKKKKTIYRLTIGKYNNKLPGVKYVKFYWENTHYFSTPATNQLNTRNFKFDF